MKPSAFKRLTAKTQLSKLLIQAGWLLFDKKYELEDETCLTIIAPKFTNLKVAQEDKMLSRLFDIHVDKDMTLDKVMAVSKKIKVNPTGLLTCAAAELTKDIRFTNKLIAAYQFDNVFIDWYNVGEILGAYIDPGVLAMIETAYYGYTPNPSAFNCYCLLHDLDITEMFNDCVIFHNQFVNKTELLIEIFGNVIRNEGRFMPVIVERKIDVAAY
jgi:hypothetical protein